MTQTPALGQYATTPMFNTKAVVRETDVPADTFRAWERRYGVPRPQRTEGSHRLYSERDIAIIRWLRDRTADGMNISQAVRMLQSFDGNAASLAAASAESAEPRAFQSLQTELIGAMTDFNALRAEHILSEAFALHRLDDVLLRVIQPLMIEVGERWHRGEMSIAVEHFTTHLIRRKLLALLSASERSTASSTIVVACAPNELHDVGVLLVALFLVRYGWHVVYLGPQLPPADLLTAVQTVQPDMVCLAASMEETARQLRDISHLLRQHASHVRVGYGGRIFNTRPELRDAMWGVYLGHDAQEVVEHVAALFAPSTSVIGR